MNPSNCQPPIKKTGQAKSIYTGIQNFNGCWKNITETNEIIKSFEKRDQSRQTSNH
jgi:hypothetical protein